MENVMNVIIAFMISVGIKFDRRMIEKIHNSINDEFAVWCLTKSVEYYEPEDTEVTWLDDRICAISDSELNDSGWAWRRVFFKHPNKVNKYSYADVPYDMDVEEIGNGKYAYRNPVNGDWSNVYGRVLDNEIFDALPGMKLEGFAGYCHGWNVAELDHEWRMKAVAEWGRKAYNEDLADEIKYASNTLRRYDAQQRLLEIAHTCQEIYKAVLAVFPGATMEDRLSGGSKQCMFCCGHLEDGFYVYPDQEMLSDIVHKYVSDNVKVEYTEFFNGFEYVRDGFILTF